MNSKLNYQVKSFNRIFLIFKISGCVFILLFLLSPKPAESARCQPNNDCYTNPSYFWDEELHACSCSAENCVFSIRDYSCDGCWCNPTMNTMVIPNDCTIFCGIAPIICEERIAINLCSTWFHSYQVHRRWLRVEDLELGANCHMSCFNNCGLADIPECGVTRCNCPRG